jgi:hypothetical protein
VSAFFSLENVRLCHVLLQDLRRPPLLDRDMSVRVSRTLELPLLVPLAVLPLAVVLRSVGPGLHTLAVHLAVLPLAVVLRSVGPGLHTLAVLHVVLPIAVVLRSVGNGVHALATPRVVRPLAVVLSPVGERLRAMTVPLAVLPLAVVRPPWGHGLDALAVRLAVLPLAVVRHLGGKGVRHVVEPRESVACGRENGVGDSSRHIVVVCCVVLCCGVSSRGVVLFSDGEPVECQDISKRHFHFKDISERKVSCRSVSPKKVCLKRKGIATNNPVVLFLFSRHLRRDTLLSEVHHMLYRLRRVCIWGRNPV